MSASEKVKTKYKDEKYAKSYDGKRYGGIFKGLKHWNTYQTVGKALSRLPQGAVIFDLPCGTGRFAGLCTSRGLRWIGADISREMMMVGTEKTNANALAAGYIQCDGEAIPLKSGGVDATLTIRVILQFPRPVRINILKELARISRQYVIVDYNHKDNFKHMLRNFRGFFGAKKHKKERLPVSEIKAELAEAGLIVDEILHVSRLFSDDALFICRKK